jgi:beta-lactam-binding protein with PASTA domain
LESSIHGKRILAGERVSKGSHIDLVIGHLQNKFPLPDFTSMTLDEAIALINGMSLELKEIHDSPSDSEELYTVQTQRPHPGDTVRAGDEIELWIIKKDE